MRFQIPFHGQLKVADRFVVCKEGITYFLGPVMQLWLSRSTDPSYVALEVVQMWREAEQA